MRFYWRQIIRTLRVISIYRSAGLVLIVKFIGKIPFFNFKYSRILVTEKNNRQGYAEGSSHISLSLMGRRLWEKTLYEGENLTAFHFYLNRSSRDCVRALRLIQRQFNWSLELDPERTVFEAGCAAGKFLNSIVDKYGGRGIGADLYEPAVRVAESADVWNEMDFHHIDLKDIERVKSLLGGGVDIAFTSSFLVHLRNSHGYRQRLITTLLEHSKTVFGVELPEPELERELERAGCRVKVIENIMYFFWQAPSC